jgi:putative transposase
VAPFVNKETGVDGNKKINGRKRHVITDTLGLVWGVVVHSANKADGSMAERVVAPLRGYLHRMETILADAAYEKVFMNWVNENLLGVKLEISSKPPATEGFVPVKWRWVTKELLAYSTSSEGSIKTMKKLLKVLKVGCFGTTARSSLIV